MPYTGVIHDISIDQVSAKKLIKHKKCLYSRRHFLCL